MYLRTQEWATANPARATLHRMHLFIHGTSTEICTLIACGTHTMTDGRSWPSLTLGPPRAPAPALSKLQPPIPNPRVPDSQLVCTTLGMYLVYGVVSARTVVRMSLVRTYQYYIARGHRRATLIRHAPRLLEGKRRRTGKDSICQFVHT